MSERKRSTHTHTAPPYLDVPEACQVFDCSEYPRYLNVLVHERGGSSYAVCETEADYALNALVQARGTLALLSYFDKTPFLTNVNAAYEGLVEAGPAIVRLIQKGAASGDD